jgi:hypothetical protein
LAEGVRWIFKLICWFSIATSLKAFFIQLPTKLHIKIPLQKSTNDLQKGTQKTDTKNIWKKVFS